MEKFKLFCVSLGCDKNLVDTENMLGLLGDAGYIFTDDETQADAILVNTCCFIGDAKEESVNTILDMARLKEEGKCRALVVAGCLAQRYRQEILDEIPEVDGILGTSSWNEVVKVVDSILKPEGEKHAVSVFEDLSALPAPQKDRVVTTGGYYAHLKIAEGCDKRCTYCIIPSLRGSYRSVPMEELVAEATRLAEKGVKEVAAGLQQGYIVSVAAGLLQGYIVRVAAGLLQSYIVSVATGSHRQCCSRVTSSGLRQGYIVRVSAGLRQGYIVRVAAGLRQDTSSVLRQVCCRVTSSGLRQVCGRVTSSVLRQGHIVRVAAGLHRLGCSRVTSSGFRQVLGRVTS